MNTDIHVLLASKIAGVNVMYLLTRALYSQRWNSVFGNKKALQDFTIDPAKF